MARVDWITISVPYDEGMIDLFHRHLSGYAYTRPHDAPSYRTTSPLDCRYPAVPAVMRQYGDKLVVSASGSAAHTVATWVVLALEHIPNYSISRLDVQRTIAVNDADEVILSTTTSPRYQRLLMDPRPGRGCTLYVGSPRSRGRLRIYNKSVQADTYPAVGEYIRIEFQARDFIAETAFSGLIVNQEDAEAYLLSFLRSRVAAMAPRLYELLPSQHVDFSAGEERLSPRYGDWLFRTVLPALRRVEMLDSDLYKRFVSALLGGQ